MEVMALTGLTTLTGLLEGLQRPLTSAAAPVPFVKRPPLLMLLLLMEKDLYRPSSSEDVPAVCRSVWDLALRDIFFQIQVVAAFFKNLTVTVMML